MEYDLIVIRAGCTIHVNDLVIHNCGIYDVSIIHPFGYSPPKPTPEQILAEERYTHYKAKMEAAKIDMEYWEERL